MPKNRACAGQSVALGVDQALDLHRHFNIAPAIEPLSGPALVRLQLGKLRLPEAQHVRFYAAKFGDISNFEVEAAGGRMENAAVVPALRLADQAVEDPDEPPLDGGNAQARGLDDEDD